MNDWRLYLVEVLESRDRLNDDRPRLLLCQKLVLLQIEVEVVALAVTEHCTKPVTHEHQLIIVIIITITGSNTSKSITEQSIIQTRHTSPCI